MSLPRLAFTCGDPAGIGPEVVMRSLRSPALRRFCEPILVGEANVWRRAGWRPGLAPLVDTGLRLKPCVYGRPSPGGGRISFSAVDLAWRLEKRGIVDGLVTAPICKESWALAGIGHMDHTEFFKNLTGAAEMLLGIPKMGVWTCLATRHVELARALKSLSIERVMKAAAALSRGLRLLGVSSPCLALCALNPHAGEAGILGREERRLLEPAAAQARKIGIRLSGPLAADAAWRLHCAGRFHGLVCLYHDQALIPLKVAGGLEVVNWTLGPLLRLSPGHGTAFDIAGLGRADPSAFIAAAELAARLARTGGGPCAARRPRPDKSRRGFPAGAGAFSGIF